MVTMVSIYWEFIVGQEVFWVLYMGYFTWSWLPSEAATTLPRPGDRYTWSTWISNRHLRLCMFTTSRFWLAPYFGMTLLLIQLLRQEIEELSLISLLFIFQGAHQQSVLIPPPEYHKCSFSVTPPTQAWPLGSFGYLGILLCSYLNNSCSSHCNCYSESKTPRFAILHKLNWGFIFSAVAFLTLFP